MVRRILVLSTVVVAFALLGYVTLLHTQSPPASKTTLASRAPAQNLDAVGSYFHAIFADDGDDASEDDDAWPADVDSPEQVLYEQPAMVRRAVADLAAPTAGKVNLYLLAFAGDGEENVFRNEVEYVAKLFDKRFAGTGHSLVLVNNPATLAHHPLATLSNLELAADGIAAKMDRDRDILMLFLTSHGSRDHLLYVSMDPLPLDQIAPEDLADVLAETRVRYKVVVISACYSGGFIDALKSPTTLVIAAARKDRSSFGCGTDSPITDFGRAYFADALNQTASLTSAFTLASKLVDRWETRDREKHSYPQIASSSKIEAQLAAWRRDVPLGPPIPFKADSKAETTAAEASKKK
ncbi:MAG: C13 family peptidase [Rudaea sp.]